MLSTCSMISAFPAGNFIKKKKKHFNRDVEIPVMSTELPV